MIWFARRRDSRASNSQSLRLSRDVVGRAERMMRFCYQGHQERRFCGAASKPVTRSSDLSSRARRPAVAVPRNIPLPPRPVSCMGAHPAESG